MKKLINDCTRAAILNGRLSVLEKVEVFGPINWGLIHNGQSIFDFSSLLNPSRPYSLIELEHADLVKQLSENRYIDMYYIDAIKFAIRHGQTEVMERLFQNDKLGSYLYDDMLLEAINYHQSEIIEIITQYGTSNNDLYRTAIQKACFKGDLLKVERMIRNTSIDPSVYYKDAISCAIWENHARIVESLLQNPDIDYALFYLDMIHYAILKKRLRILNLLLWNPHIDINDYYDKAWVSAVYSDDVTVVEMFLEHHCAIPSKIYPPVMNQIFLLANITIMDKILENPRVDLTPFYRYRNGDLDSFGECIRHPLVNYTEWICNQIMAVCATFCGNIDLLKTLIKAKNVQDLSFASNICLRLAACRGFIHVVRFLLSDPTVNPADKNNEALMCASRHGYEQVVELLLNDPRVDQLVQAS